MALPLQVQAILSLVGHLTQEHKDLLLEKLTEASVSVNIEPEDSMTITVKSCHGITIIKGHTISIDYIKFPTISALQLSHVAGWTQLAAKLYADGQCEFDEDGDCISVTFTSTIMLLVLDKLSEALSISNKDRLEHIQKFREDCIKKLSPQ